MRRQLIHRGFTTLVLFIGLLDVRAQQASSSSASEVLSQSLSILTGAGAPSQDVLLTGEVSYAAGPFHEEGTVRLLSHQSGMTRVEIATPSVSLSETRRVLCGGTQQR